jgi:energy-coupling factor transporter ATP-binding protein EcfA2
MDFLCQFKFDEEFNEHILARYRDEYTYDSFSEGEKLRIDLALLFTWRAISSKRNSISTNLLILDEIFDSSLESEGIDAFMKLLELEKNTNTYIISHRGDQLIEKFENVIAFVKNNNFSKKLKADVVEAIKDSKNKRLIFRS